VFWWPFSWWRWTWVDCSKLGFINNYLEFTALTLLVGRQEGHPACKIIEWWGAGVVICLEQGADLHTAQLMPLPLIVSCFSKIQIGFTFLVPAHSGSPGQRAIKRVCVCVCVCACVRACVHACVRACVHACVRACVRAWCNTCTVCARITGLILWSLLLVASVIREIRSCSQWCSLHHLRTFICYTPWGRKKERTNFL